MTYYHIKACHVKGCKEAAECRTAHPSSEQKAYLCAKDSNYYICDECENKGWRYNCVYDEYYLMKSKKVKISLFK